MSLQFCFRFFFTSLMKKSMITVRLQYYINSARALLLAAEVTRFFFHLISRSHFSHPNFTNCKLQNTRMLTDTDHSRVRCSPIDSGMLKRPGTRSWVLGSRVLREDLYLQLLQGHSSIGCPLLRVCFHGVCVVRVCVRVCARIWMG